MRKCANGQHSPSKNVFELRKNEATKNIPEALERLPEMFSIFPALFFARQSYGALSSSDGKRSGVVAQLRWRGTVMGCQMMRFRRGPTSQPTTREERRSFVIILCSVKRIGMHLKYSVYIRQREFDGFWKEITVYVDYLKIIPGFRFFLRVGFCP